MVDCRKKIYKETDECIKKREENKLKKNKTEEKKPVKKKVEETKPVKKCKKMEEKQPVKKCKKVEETKPVKKCKKVEEKKPVKKCKKVEEEKPVKKCKVDESKKSSKKECVITGYKKMWDVTKDGVMLAHTYRDNKTGKIKSAPRNTTQAPKGWYVSEKYDGYRAIWDGKDFRSRANNIFNAPDWFKLWMPPGIVLDGELFLGRGKFEDSGFIRKKVPDDKKWMNIKFQVFDTPSHKGMFEERQDFIEGLIKERCKCKNLITTEYKIDCPLVITHQTKIESEKELDKMFDKLTKKNAEGVMLRAPNSPYENKRSSYLLKVKKKFDDECKIVGYNAGTGKYSGKLGSFKCQLVKDPSITFNISGMTDEIRDNYKKTHKLGTKITFTYMELSQKGVPRHPRYLRIRK